MSLIICSNDFDTFTLRSPISRIQTLSSRKLLQCTVLFAFSGFCVGVVNGHWSFNAKMEVDDLYSPLTRQCVLLWLIMEKNIFAKKCWHFLILMAEPTHLILDLLELKSRMRNKDTQDLVSTMLRSVGLLFPNLVWYVGPWKRTPWWCSCSPTCAARGRVGSRNPPVVGTWRRCWWILTLKRIDWTTSLFFFWSDY